MEGAFSSRERRNYPWVFINSPLEYQDTGDSCVRGARVVNAGDGGFLIETTRDIPIGTELSITVLFPTAFELANFKAVAKVVRKELYRKEDWRGNQYGEGYQYGLEFIQILNKDRWKLNWLLGGRFEFDEIFQSLCCQL